MAHTVWHLIKSMHFNNCSGKARWHASLVWQTQRWTLQILRVLECKGKDMTFNISMGDFQGYWYLQILFISPPWYSWVKKSCVKKIGKSIILFNRLRKIKLLLHWFYHFTVFISGRLYISISQFKDKCYWTLIQCKFNSEHIIQ